MCSLCIDAVKNAFPEYPDNAFIDFVLWEHTAFPFAPNEHIAHQVLMLRGTAFSHGEGI